MYTLLTEFVLDIYDCFGCCADKLFMCNDSLFAKTSLSVFSNVLIATLTDAEMGAREGLQNFSKVTSSKTWLSLLSNRMLLSC